MEHSQHVLMTLIVSLFCIVCVAVALPAARPEVMQGDLTHLVKLIGKLKTLDTQRHGDTADNWAVLSEAGNPNAGQSLSTGSASTSGSDKLSALKRGFLGFNKRQGAWSYDYGLGGGRFGKRYYGDYGIGGGRFGRDVDHVDIADTSDATM
uniref:CCK-2 n=1 Tax=Charonia tritonis TaxID=1960912 RepID=A0A1S6JQ13_9CAEN|nr:CCK-2 precursor [Charonia tritonis]